MPPSWLFVVAGAFAFVGCNASGSVSGGDLLFDAGSGVCTPVTSGTPAATFTDVYSMIINGSPECDGCHTPPTPTGELDLSTQAIAYKNLVGQPVTTYPSCFDTRDVFQLVEPGNACNSLIYRKVTDAPCGARMPYEGPALTQAQTDLLGSWINAGAKND